MNIKNLLIKLSKNQTMINLANKIFKYFPNLKYTLIDYVYSYPKQRNNTVKYQNNFLEKIKEEIEELKDVI
ncbi:MAG: hypothetical protein U9R37_00915 [Campylobacterota bacterium]|nr:hypothetical protein [Campylobacterota bacterium]